jgi:hypothetical protein
MPNDGIASSPEGKLGILAAALAHEAGHACSGCFDSQDGGQSFAPPCNRLNNEIDCLSLEISILQCINAGLSEPDDDITARAQGLALYLLAAQAVAALIGC